MRNIEENNMNVLLLTSATKMYFIRKDIHIKYLKDFCLNLPSEAIDKETNGEGANDPPHREDGHRD